MYSFSVLITLALALSTVARPSSRRSCRARLNNPKVYPNQSDPRPNVVHPTTVAVDNGGSPTGTPNASISLAPTLEATTSTPVNLPTSTEVPPTTPTTVAAPPPPPPPTPAGGDNGNGGGSATEIETYLSAHNDFRAKYHAPPLRWNAKLAQKAQEWADKCVFKHSGGSLGPYGENLAAGTGSYTIADGIKGWTDESSNYDFNNPTYDHFTQVVWKSTEELGCAYQFCDGIFKPEFGKARYIVCEYAKPGNLVGASAANVLRP